MGMMHVRVGAPSICIVQAPQAPTPQPNLLPVRPKCSRTTHNSGTSSGPSNSAGFPFTKNLINMLGGLSVLALQSLPAGSFARDRHLKGVVGEWHDVEPSAGGMQQGLRDGGGNGRQHHLA